MYKIMHESCFYGIIKKTMWFKYQMEVLMTEREKMLAGELYDCGDAELLTQWHKAKDLVRDYNQTNSADADEKEQILKELLGGKGKNLWITAPFYVDYGNNIYFGNNCEVNINCTFLDDNIIRIGDNVVIGAGSVVTKNIPDNVIAAGSPCRVLRRNQ